MKKSVATLAGDLRNAICRGAEVLPKPPYLEGAVSLKLYGESC